MNDNAVSVVMVCFNRQKDAESAIKSLLNQTMKPFEIIVIDDGSTPSLNLNFDSTYVKLVRLEKEVGLSKARNIGASLASGRYVAFIDDDAIAERNWVYEIQTNMTDVDVFGGAIYPLYEANPPDWWNERDFGEYVGVGNMWKSHGRNQIWGTNMVIARNVFGLIGFFDPLFGRQKGKLTSCEEEDFIKRAKRRGLRIRFIAKARVYHKVKPSRMTLKYLIRRSYYAGKSQRAMDGFKPLRTFFEILKLTLLSASPSTLVSTKKDRIDKLIWMAWLIGCLL